MAFQPKNAGKAGARGREVLRAAVGCRYTRRSAPQPNRRRADRSELSLAAQHAGYEHRTDVDPPAQWACRTQRRAACNTDTDTDTDTVIRQPTPAATSYSESLANSRASRSLSTAGADPGSRLPATSGVNSRVTAPTTPAKISMYAGVMALPVPETNA
jgi:hypothetical protein